MAINEMQNGCGSSIEAARTSNQKRRRVNSQKTARRKLQYLNAADSLNDLSAPSGNRLEALKGDRRGQHSILINDQWRMTPYRVAKDIGVTPIAITQITKGRAQSRLRPLCSWRNTSEPVLKCGSGHKLNTT
jgi:plasmid maintenance system killer protein